MKTWYFGCRIETDVYKILQFYHPLASWPDTVDTDDAVDVIRSAISVQHTAEAFTSSLLHATTTNYTQATNSEHSPFLLHQQMQQPGIFSSSTARNVTEQSL